MSKLSKLKSISLVCLYCLISPNLVGAVSYQLSNNQNLQIHGFASQSFIYTDNNNVFGNSSDNGSFDYTELGVNVSFQAWTKLHTAAQLLSRRAGASDNGKLRIDFALADYRYLTTSQYSLGIRAGRVKNPFGFYNDTRDVSFTRASIILPQSIYFERTRELSISSDGLQLYGHRDIRLGTTRFQLFVAQPRVEDNNTELALLNENKPGNFSGKLSYLSRIDFITHNNRFRLALSNVILNMDYEPAPVELAAGFTQDASLQFNLSILSIEYSYKKWSFTSEYAIRKLRFNKILYLPAPLDKTTGESYYIQLAYRFNYHWKFIWRYDVLYQDRNDRDGSKYAENTFALGSPKPAYSAFAKDLTIGLQWNFNRRWMFRLEAHSVDGTAWLPIQDNSNLDQAAQKWRMVTTSLSFRF